MNTSKQEKNLSWQQKLSNAKGKKSEELLELLAGESDNYYSECYPEFQTGAVGSGGVGTGAESEFGKGKGAEALAQIQAAKAITSGYDSDDDSSKGKKKALSAYAPLHSILPQLVFCRFPVVSLLLNLLLLSFPSSHLFSSPVPCYIFPFLFLL